MVWNERKPNKPEGCTMSRLQYHCEQKMDSVSMKNETWASIAVTTATRISPSAALVMDNVQN